MCDERERLIGFVYDDCDPAEQREIERHVDGCDTCRREIGALRNVRQDLLAWDVPSHEPIWRPLVPAPIVSSWRQIPVWTLAAAASVMFAVGAALLAGLLAHHRRDGLRLFEAAEPYPVVDVGGFADAKLAALHAHRSQLLSTMGIDEHATITEVDAQRQAFDQRVLDRLQERGALEGVAQGEAFKLMADL